MAIPIPFKKRKTHPAGEPPKFTPKTTHPTPAAKPTAPVASEQPDQNHGLPLIIVAAQALCPADPESGREDRQARLARIYGLSTAAVSGWRHKGIPYAWVLRIVDDIRANGGDVAESIILKSTREYVEFTKYKRERLRNDLI